MPEGPEIRRAADEIAKALTGREATEVFFAFEHLKQYEALLMGKEVDAVSTKGKAMIVHFANGYNIYSHNQLYGQWLVRDAYDLPDTDRQLRLAIHNRQKSALLYSASDVEVLTDKEIKNHPFLSKLGPDLLDESVTIEHVIDRLMHKRFYRRRLTSLLLDQQFVAGMGNYLRSEVLFVARVHPSLKPADCTPDQIRRLAQAMIELTRQSYQTGGVTNNLELAKTLRRQGHSRKEYRFWVFNRAAEPCYVCGTLIVKEIVSGRRLYFCPSCQSL